MEDRVGNSNLADVVQERGRTDVPDLGGRQPQGARHRTGHLDDRLRVLTGIAVALEQRDRERLDRIAALDRLDDLGLHGLAR